MSYDDWIVEKVVPLYNMLINGVLHIILHDVVLDSVLAYYQPPKSTIRDL
jgi:hypothetical protein